MGLGFRMAATAGISICMDDMEISATKHTILDEA
jgi:hypothetical protein